MFTPENRAGMNCWIFLFVIIVFGNLFVIIRLCNYRMPLHLAPSSVLRGGGQPMLEKWRSDLFVATASSDPRAMALRFSLPWTHHLGACVIYQSLTLSSPRVNSSAIRPGNLQLLVSFNYYYHGIFTRAVQYYDIPILSQPWTFVSVLFFF